MFGQNKTFLIKKKLGQKKFGSKEFLGPKKFGSNKMGQKSLLKIGSVTAEIFLIWKNVARTNVAGTNVIVTVRIC